MSRQSLEAVLENAREHESSVLVFAIGGDPRIVDVNRAVNVAGGALAEVTLDERGSMLVACLERGKTEVRSAKETGDWLAQEIDDTGGTSIGVATDRTHRDMSLDELIAVAAEGLEVALASSPGRAVHSELYDLTIALQRRRGAALQIGAAPVAVVADYSTSLDIEEDPFAFEDFSESPSATAPPPIGGTGVVWSSTGPDEQRYTETIQRLKEEIEQLRMERADTESSERSSHEKLERRIEKLLVQLEDAEREVEVLRAEQASDPGVASHYKSVQGLAENAPNRRMREGMLDGVFEANGGSGSAA